MKFYRQYSKDLIIANADIEVVQYFIYFETQFTKHFLSKDINELYVGCDIVLVGTKAGSFYIKKGNPINLPFLTSKFKLNPSDIL